MIAASRALLTRLEPRGVRVALITLGVVAILFVRRSAELFDPQVWDEEGQIIAQLVSDGVATLLTPMNGYLIVLPRLLTFAAMLLPFDDYPLGVTVLTWALTAALLLPVALVASRLRGGVLLVLVGLLVPTNAEVFGLPLYIFWWTVPLLYASYFWCDVPRIAAWRTVVIVVSGLSSPAIAIVAPLYLMRAIRRRTRGDTIVALAATACALIQISFILSTTPVGSSLTLAAIDPAIRKLVGGYLTWNLLPKSPLRAHVAFVGGLLALGFVGAVLRREYELRRVLYPLAYLWCGSLLLSLSRAHIYTIDQVEAGPRYFFLPFIVEGWILLQIAFDARRPTPRIIAATMLGIAACNALPVLKRGHDDLAWKASVAACARAGDTTPVAIPIEFNGHAAEHWDLTLTGSICRRLQRSGIAGLAGGVAGP